MKNYTNQQNQLDQRNQWITEDLWGMIPVYSENGCNGCSILFKSRPPVYHKRSIKTLLNTLAIHHQKDIKLIRSYAYGITGQKGLNPLPFSHTLVLVPFRVREAVGRDDGVYGYITESAVLRIDEVNDYNIVILKNGTRIPVYENIKTLQKRLSTTKRLVNILTERAISGNPANLALNEVTEAYNQPATKGDIALLSQSILSYMRYMK